jgi:ribosomal protein L12E/L44/L45/RPP1/RPP2
MKVVAAYLLAVLGGKSSPTDKDIKKILSSGKFVVTSVRFVCLFV